MSNPFLSEIRLFPFSFPPKGWAFCQGQLMAISQNTALFSLLGTIYGGNGTSTFALPDLRGRVTMSSGQGAGLSVRTQGDAGGEETVTLILNQLPSHQHALSAVGTMNGKNAAGDRRSPVSSVPAMESSGATATYSGAAPDASMRAGGVTFGGTATATAAGGGLPHENRQPLLALNFCIALQGVYPSRT